MAITKATSLANFASGITGIGSVGIGTTDPRLDLEINGDVRLSDNSPRIELHDLNASGASSATGGFEVFDKAVEQVVCWCGCFLVPGSFV